MLKENQVPATALVPLSYVISITNLSDSTIRRLEKTSCFPRRRQISPRRVGWVLDDILSWVHSRNLVSPPPSK